MEKDLIRTHCIIELTQGVDALKKSIESMIETGHYVSMSSNILEKQDRVTQTYICRRIGSIFRLCPYKIEFTEFEDPYTDGTAVYGYKKTIRIRESNATLSQFETLIHEWTHIVLHGRRNAVEKDKLTKELEAETVSFIVGYVLGSIDTLAHTYIYEKIEDVTKDKKEQLCLLADTYKKSEERIIKTALKILDKLSPIERQIKYHRKSNGEKLI